MITEAEKKALARRRTMKKNMFKDKITTFDINDKKNKSIHDNILAVRFLRGWDIDKSDQYKNISGNVVSSYGFKYEYKSDTSNEDTKYLSLDNKYFYRLSKKNKD